MAANKRTQPNIGGKVAAAIVATLAVVVVPTAGGSTPERPPRAAAAPIEPRVLADLAISRPLGLAVADDGTAYVSESTTSRVVRVTDAGTEVVLRLGDGQFPYGLALADDGTLVVAAGSGVVTLAPDGEQRSIPIDGAGEITSIDVDAAGVMYVADRTRQEVLQVDPDGTVAVVPFTGLGELWGIDVDDAGTVSVVDATKRDVVQRTAAGVQSDVGIAGLEAPFGIDITDGRMLISDSSRVIVRATDGSVAELLQDQPGPRGVVLQPDGTATVAVDGFTGCRCPEDPGYVTRVPSGGTPTRLDLGDLRTITSAAAAEPGSVLFTSSDGAPGYSPINPLRRVDGDGPIEDLSVDGDPPRFVDAAPDGTTYLLRTEGTKDVVVRRDDDGSTTPIDLPAEPGLDQAIGLTVDEGGRLFVMMNSGYGSGGFVVWEPLAAGGPKAWFRSAAGQSPGPMAAGAGALHLAVSDSSAIRLLRIDLSSGAVTDRRSLEAPPYAMDVDSGGRIYLIGDVQAAAGVIHAIDPDGEVSEVSYAGEGSPNGLSMASDGTLYVSDTEIGLLALDGVGTAAAPAPGGAAPATPVPGSASYTG